MTAISRHRLTVTPELIGWCPEHETYQPPIDRWCGFIDHEHTNGKLRRRRMYICWENACPGKGFFNRQAYLDHDHEDCYY